MSNSGNENCLCVLCGRPIDGIVALIRLGMDLPDILCDLCLVDSTKLWENEKYSYLTEANNYGKENNGE